MTGLEEFAAMETSTGTPRGADGHVNFGWLGESWRLFSENAAIWVSAVIIAVFAPLVFTGAVMFLSKFAHHATATNTGIDPGLQLGLGVLNAIYSAFILGGVGQMAVKQVSLRPITFRDIFSGAPVFGNMLLFTIASSVLLFIGVVPFIGIGSIFVAAMLLPAFAMVADGKPVGSVMALSFKSMLRDRGVAMAFIFVIALTLTVTSFTVIGPLITLPMCWLISALAYRDVVGIAQPAESIDAILGIDPASAASPATPIAGTFGYSEGAPRVSLTGEPLEDQGGVPPARP